MADKKTTVYFKDPEEFKYLRNAVASLWYEIHGVTLSTGDVILSSLMFTLDRLERERREVVQDLESRVSSVYYRINR